jgi:hypothetical protein
MFEKFPKSTSCHLTCSLPQKDFERFDKREKGSSWKDNQGNA